MTNAAPDIPTGPDVIQGYLRTLTAQPGVYRMLDAQSRVLYVGKARNLKARVANYARLTGHGPRITRMILDTASMMFLTTRTETEALLLEQNLIKQLKPRFNVLLRDDKSFPNILVSAEHPFPQLKKHRGAKTEKGSYFGPFASAGAVNRTLNQLQKVFLLRNCTDATFESRTRPCLLYQIKRCSAPCVGHISQDDYAAAVRDATRFLRGETTGLQEALAAEMTEAAEAMEFERAAALRDRIRALTNVQSSQGINPRGVTEADVIGLHMEGGQACVQVFFIRAGQNWGNRDFYPRIGPDNTEAEVLAAFIGQFYQTKEAPRQLILSHAIEEPDLMAAALSESAPRKVEIVVPQRGEKVELVRGAVRNARESLGRKLAETQSQGKLLAGLAEAFDLAEAPARVEVYDNSHIQGTNAVGAMIVAGPEGFEKSQYRKFNIRGDSLSPGDDFGMMKEVLTRRFQRLLKEDPDRQGETWPDALLIDGGAGQVAAVDGILADLGVADMPVIGVAKGVDRDHGKEEFYRPGGPGPSPCRATIRSCTSCSACATRRTALPSARTAPSAPNPWARRRLTTSPVWAPPASARFWAISAAPRPSAAPTSPISRRSTASARAGREDLRLLPRWRLTPFAAGPAALGARACGGHCPTS